MSQSTHLGDHLQTQCTHCDSQFRITLEQLDVARGQVRCSECQQVFNALLHLDNYAMADSIPKPPEQTPDALSDDFSTANDKVPPQNDHDRNLPVGIDDESIGSVLSLDEAMYGQQSARDNQPLHSLLWFSGILLMIIISIIQLIYYQRYHLIASSQYQQQILSLCNILPCDRSRFKNPEQMRMLERHVFSHPTRDNALMVTGSFINDAPFAQALPGILISLSDINGRLIANREFSHREYLAGANQTYALPGQTVQFRLEIVDPGAEALTYEFEFI